VLAGLLLARSRWARAAALEPLLSSSLRPIPIPAIVPPLILLREWMTR
jgi:ABC-type nitrate/sulfonate/bicarbonate transport system permease component